MTVTVLTLMLSVESCKSGKSRSVRRARGHARTEVRADMKRNMEKVHGLRRAIIEEALTWEGTPYRYAGAEKKSGTDCSGMVLRVYEDITKIKLPRNSAKQEEFCEYIDARDVSPGDLAFFATGSDRTKVSHVGVMIDDRYFIHASASKGVVISDITTPYYQRTFISFGRVPGM